MSDNEIKDRFTTQWTGPEDERAQAYASKHGINYKKTNMLPSNHPDNIDLPALKAANLASDAADRAQHAADPEINTGTHIFTRSTDTWDLCTRGSKLRFCAQERGVLEEQSDRIDSHRDYLEDFLDNAPGAQPPARWLLKVERAAEVSEKELALLDELEKKVLDEKVEGWDWEQGLRDQLVTRSKLWELRHKKLTAWEACGLYR